MLNGAAYEALGMPAAVTLMYDEDRRVIGLKPGDMRHPNSFPVKQNDKWSNRRIQLHAFCRHFGIDIRRTVMFNEIDIDREGLMKLELNRTVTIGRASQNREQ